MSPGFNLPTGPAKPVESGSGLAGNRSEPVKFKFEFKRRRAIGSDRLTGRLDRFTCRFDRFTSRFDW